MRLDQIVISASKLRFPASSSILMNDVLLGSAVDCRLRPLESGQLHIGSLGCKKLLDRGFHLRLRGLVTPSAPVRLPDSFLCV